MAAYILVEIELSYERYDVTLYLRKARRTPLRLLSMISGATWIKARFSQLHLSNKLNNEVVVTKGAVVIRMRQYQWLKPQMRA